MPRKCLFFAEPRVADDLVNALYDNDDKSVKSIGRTHSLCLLQGRSTGQIETNREHDFGSQDARTKEGASKKWYARRLFRYKEPIKSSAKINAGLQDCGNVGLPCSSFTGFFPPESLRPPGDFTKRVRSHEAVAQSPGTR